MLQNIERPLKGGLQIKAAANLQGQIAEEFIFVNGHF
jgi:hypothetical protein